MKKTFLVLSLVFAATFVMNAQTAPATTSSTTQTEPMKTEKKHTHKKHSATADAMYQCPMKCEAASKTAGKCAKCGMEKVKIGAK